MSKRKMGYTHISEGEYDNIKRLQSAGINITQAASTSKRSKGTIGKIYKCDTLEEYKNLSRELTEKYSSPKESFASANTIFDVIQQAKGERSIIMTTHAAFVGFDDLYDFIKEASDNKVTVTFAPMGAK